MIEPDLSSATFYDLGFTRATAAAFDPNHTLFLHDLETGHLMTIRSAVIVIADAGLDQTVEWTSGGVSVTLDGTGSSDSDRDQLTFSWTDANNVVVGTGPTPTIDLGSLGIHTITLTVDDGQATDTDDVLIDVVDTTPPDITVALVPAPEPDDEDDDDDEVDVDDDEGLFRVEFSCSDACDTNPTITSAMLNGIAVTNGQIVKLELEDDDDEQEVEFHHGILEIEASSFALTVTCVDASGNEATATAVPQFAEDDDDDDRKRRRHRNR